MANIDINLGATLINKTNASGSQGDALSDAIGVVFQGIYAFSLHHQAHSSYTQTDSHLVLNYADGASTRFAGAVPTSSGDSNGMATALQVELYQPSAYSVTMNGLMTYRYAAGPRGPSVDGQGSTIYMATLQTLLSPGSPSYNPDTGNVTLTLNGNIQLSPTHDIAGTMTSLDISGGMLLSSHLEGDFTIGGNTVDVVQNHSRLALSGTATSYTKKYTDGSSISMSQLGLQVGPATQIDESLLANSANLPADDIINVTLGATPGTPWLIASGAGNDQVTIRGGGSSLSVNGGSGNDVITLGDDNHSIDGGDGVDTAVFRNGMSEYNITATAGGYTVQDNHPYGGADTVAGIERLQFQDFTLALDIAGNAGQVYRLYQAAFNRTPDSGGLAYWIKAKDSGVTLDSIAAEFSRSAEFTARYGAAPSNAVFLDKLYHNVLHRAGDTAGFNWWLGHLNAGDSTQALVLAQFGESEENQAALIGAIRNGIVYFHDR